MFKKLRSTLKINNSVWKPSILFWAIALIVLSFMFYASGKAVKMYGETGQAVCQFNDIKDQINSIQLELTSFSKSDNVDNSHINQSITKQLKELNDSTKLKLSGITNKKVLLTKFNDLLKISKDNLTDPLKRKKENLSRMKIMIDEILIHLKNDQTNDLNNFKYFRVIILLTMFGLFLLLGLLILFYNKSKISDYNKIETSVLQLEKQKIHLENLIDSTPAAIAVVDNQDIVKRINNKFTTLFGYNENEAIGKALSKLIISDQYLEEGRILSSISNLKDERSEKTTKRKHKNGELIDVQVVGSPIFVDNNFEGIYAIYQDITEQINHENELLESKKHAENADKLKSVFLAQMSHEIRTPINAMVSLASLLKDDLSEHVDEDHKLSLELINKSGGRIIRTVDLLLNLSELQTGTYQTIKKRFDLYTDVLSNLMVEYKKVATEKNINFAITLETTDTSLFADSHTANQIFDQLIDNAIKYTNSGSIEIKALRNSINNLVIEIIDTGIGIDENYIPNLFEPFSQEEMGYSRKYEGNGIGLTLVKNYCTLNNATIEVESKKDSGSTFRVIFNNGTTI